MEDGKGIDMMETDSGSSAAPQPAHHNIDQAKGYLRLARRFINEDKPNPALKAIVMAVRAYGGEQAVSELMARGREIYSSRVQQRAAVEQLTSLLGGCAIGEAHESQPETPVTEAGPAASEVQENSILAETGRNQVIEDAFADGSSFICSKCGGLVGMSRRDEHYAFWCSKM